MKKEIPTLVHPLNPEALQSFNEQDWVEAMFLRAMRVQGIIHPNNPETFVDFLRQSKTLPGG